MNALTTKSLNLIRKNIFYAGASLYIKLSQRIYSDSKTMTNETNNNELFLLDKH